VPYYASASQILYKWTGTSSNLAALQALVGVKYTGGTGANAMAIINKAFDNIIDTVYMSLMAQTHYSHLYYLMEPIGTDDNMQFGMPDVAEEIFRIMSVNQAQGERLLIDFVKNMYAITMLESVDMDGFRNTLAAKGKRYELLLDTAAGKNIIYGTAGNDKLKGTNSGDIYWVEKGTNTIDGGLGDNTYFIGKDFGTNTVTDAGGDNTILLMCGIDQTNIQVMRIPGTSDVQISVSGESGTIIIKGYDLKADYSLVFPDGSISALHEMLGWTEINTVEELLSVKDDLYRNYRLMSDFDLDGIIWEPIGKSTAPFVGIFDGNGHSIGNLSVNMGAQDYAGLFGCSKGAIANLTIEGAEVKGRNYVGVLAGYSNGSNHLYRSERLQNYRPCFA
jgi:Ca2+-binding RTX toxin-like protein